MNKYVLCALPLPLKKIIGITKTLIDSRKRSAINGVNSLADSSFPKINSSPYKNGLKMFLRECAYTADETRDYVKWLYSDAVKMVNYGEINPDWPTIICVIKNEIDKLPNFFSHYDKIGQFNYVFIDNGSTDGSLELVESKNAVVYQCLEKFSTNRKLAWINKVYSTLPEGMWTVLLDADELLVYDGYEKIPFNSVMEQFNKKRISTAAAIMIDMFPERKVNKKDYLSEYIYFENLFHEEKSFYFNSVYGGIREREFKFGNDRMFLIKKHPVVRKDNRSMLIHCHYIYPFDRNFESVIYFGLLHYKLFESEIEKYKSIAEAGSYGNGSIEYKTYLKAFKEKSYEQIFAQGNDTIKYTGTDSLKKIKCLMDIRGIMNE